MAETVILLHGFAGTRHGWDLVVDRLDRELYEPVALDLRGHGEARERRPVSFETIVDDVLETAPGRFVLCGYSMGGRIALQVALAAPERVTRLVLVATTAGLEDAAEREERVAADERLAAAAERGTIEDFARRWCGQPLFADDPPHVGAQARRDIARNDPAALAEALRGIGTGRMEPLWGRLAELTMTSGCSSRSCRTGRVSGAARSATRSTATTSIRTGPGR